MSIFGSDGGLSPCPWHHQFITDTVVKRLADFVNQVIERIMSTSSFTKSASSLRPALRHTLIFENEDDVHIAKKKIRI